MRGSPSKRRKSLEAADVAVGLGAATILVVSLVHRMAAHRAAGQLTLEIVAACLVGAIVVATAIAVLGSAHSSHKRRGRIAEGRKHRGRIADGRVAPEGFAGRRELQGLVVQEPTGDRLVLGSVGPRGPFSPRRNLVAVERLQSLLVVGPSQSGKTTGIAIPAISQWRGPVIATSVKSDLVQATLAARASLGEVAIFDPTSTAGSTPPGARQAGWSPLESASSLVGARRVAEALCSAGRSGGIDDASFWYGSAERLLAPLLLAANRSSGCMTDVVGWLDDQALDEPILALEASGERQAARTARSFAGLEERQRSSVIATAQSVVSAYGDPEVGHCERFAERIGAPWVLDAPAGHGPRTLYCCAPQRDQARLSPLFVALIREAIDAAFLRAGAGSKPLCPPLLVVLDEAANIAPLGDLDRILSTAAGHGVVLLTVWQDLAQIQARFGERAATIVNNHRAKAIFPGIADPRTLELLSALVGDAESVQHSRSVSSAGEWSETESLTHTPAAPAGWIRQIPQGSLLLLYGALPPALLEVQPRVV